MNTSEYQVCRRCIMDTSDPGIQFDGDGLCNRCKAYEHAASKMLPVAERKSALNALVTRMKIEGRDREYDCVIGVSGGVDSTYVAWLVKHLGLRALAVHVDNGWDSNLAVENIEHCLKTLGIDLFTHVLDWEEFKDLQLAFLRASTPDCEIPTDHAILAVLHRKAAEFGIRHIIYGANTVTEGMSVPTWSCGHYDWKYIRSVHRRFGTATLRTYPHLSLWDFFWLRHVRGIQFVNCLDLIEYDKAEALAVIQRELGWKPYDRKHHESIYTRFYQSYILPRKFKADKRRIHLSALIMAGQMSREEALADMERAICPAEQVREDRKYVCMKLGLTEAEFESLLTEPPKTFWHYPSSEKELPLKVYRMLRSTART